MTAHNGDSPAPKSGTASAPEASAAFDGVAISRKRSAAINLLLVFCTAYFVAAMVATPEFKHIANIQVLNIPLGFYTGILVFVVGVVVTRVFLNQDRKK